MEKRATFSAHWYSKNHKIEAFQVYQKDLIFDLGDPKRDFTQVVVISENKNIN